MSLLKAYRIKIMGRKPSKCTGAKKKKKSRHSYRIWKGEKERTQWFVKVLNLMGLCLNNLNEIILI